MNLGLFIAGVSWTLTSVLILLVSRALGKNPGKPNNYSGYRTKQSMASLENWRILNLVAMKRLFQGALVCLFASLGLILLSLIEERNHQMNMVLWFLPVLCLLIPVLLTYFQEEQILGQYKSQ